MKEDIKPNLYASEDGEIVYYVGQIRETDKALILEPVLEGQDVRHYAEASFRVNFKPISVESVLEKDTAGEIKLTPGMRRVLTNLLE